MNMLMDDDFPWRGYRCVLPLPPPGDPMLAVLWRTYREGLPVTLQPPASMTPSTPPISGYITEFIVTTEHVLFYVRPS